LVAAKYLNFAGVRSIVSPVVPATTGRHGAVCRVVVGRRIERRIGIVVATRGRLCGTRLELAAPIRMRDDRKDGEPRTETALFAQRDTWRLASAFAVACGLLVVVRDRRIEAT